MLSFTFALFVAVNFPVVSSYVYSIFPPVIFTSIGLYPFNSGIVPSIVLVFSNSSFSVSYVSTTNSKFIFPFSLSSALSILYTVLDVVTNIVFSTLPYQSVDNTISFLISVLVPSSATCVPVNIILLLLLLYLFIFFPIFAFTFPISNFCVPLFILFNSIVFVFSDILFFATTASFTIAVCNAKFSPCISIFPFSK